MTGNRRYLTGAFIAWALALSVLALQAFPASGLAAEPENDPPGFQGYRRPFILLRPPQPIPVTPLHTLKGGVTTLMEFTGKVVLLNVWATWCPACLHEMPVLDSLQAALGGDKFQVVSVSVDTGGAGDVRPYLKRLGIRDLPVYLDPSGRTALALGVREGMPWTFLIDHRGRVMGYMKGAGDWDSGEGRALIRYYTGRIPPRRRPSKAVETRRPAW